MKEIEFQNYEELFKEIKNKDCRLVAIDGNKGTGKTNLSYHIGAELIKHVINVDNFYSRNKEGYYLGAINYGLLLQRINRLTKYERPIIIEGVCLIEVLEKISIHSDLLIYCKEISQGKGIWQSEDYLNVQDQEKLDHLISVNFPPLTRLDMEIAKYHYQYRPFEKADIIYHFIKQ